jgi:uncharacterized membrane protein
MNQNVSTTGTSKRLGTRQLTIVGMLSAISIIMAMTPLGFIQIPGLPARVTLMHIPVIVGAILEGPIVGIMIGFIFGAFSFAQNWMAPTSALFFAFRNPLVSILPRVLIGIIAYYTYKHMFGKNDSVKLGAAAVLGSLMNTFGVLSMINIFYGERAAQILKATPETITKVIYGMALTNGTPEFIVATMITIPVVMALRKIKE